MTDKQYVDGMLLVWGERWDWSRLHEKPKMSRSGTGVRLTYSPRPMPARTADTVRATLKKLAHGAPQVMVKISGGGRGLRQVYRHMDYISRHGELPVEDQDGNEFLGKDGLEDLRQAWGEGGYPIPEDSTKREAINIVLSMPEGTDELAVLRAARDFAAAEFGGRYQYIMALHTFTTDPDEEPSRHPHVHLAVKSRGLDGSRLDPRKADLRRWRARFANNLGDHGVEAVATKRVTRLERPKREPQAIRHARGRGESIRNDVTSAPQPAAVVRCKSKVAQVLADYKDVAEALASSGPEDRRLSVDLVRHLERQRSKPEVVPELAQGGGRDGLARGR
jgi:hypothetical protein